MAAVAHRPNALRRQSKRPKSSGEDGKSLWSTLLESVATGKRLPEKTILVLGAFPKRSHWLLHTNSFYLGGTVETQTNFTIALSSDPSYRRRPVERSGARKPLIANRFALGYTYQDVLEGDQDGADSLALEDTPY